MSSLLRHVTPAKAGVQKQGIRVSTDVEQINGFINCYPVIRCAQRSVDTGLKIMREMWEAQGEGAFGYFKGMAGNGGKEKAGN